MCAFLSIALTVLAKNSGRMHGARGMIHWQLRWNLLYETTCRIRSRDWSCHKLTLRRNGCCNLNALKLRWKRLMAILHCFNQTKTTTSTTPRRAIWSRLSILRGRRQLYLLWKNNYDPYIHYQHTNTSLQTAFHILNILQKDNTHSQQKKGNKTAHAQHTKQDKTKLQI